MIYFTVGDAFLVPLKDAPVCRNYDEVLEEITARAWRCDSDTVQHPLNIIEVTTRAHGDLKQAMMYRSYKNQE